MRLNELRTAMLSVLVVMATLPWSEARADLLSLASKPLYLTGAVPPKVMLDISRDHQLYYKAYNDYSDLDNDGKLETTYDHGQDYYGYFDSYKCYDYVESHSRFEPVIYTAKTGSESASAANLTAKLCSGKWSGNFLNWVSMSRMDVVRKLLYGGYRSTDTTGDAGTTTLERALIPTDGHAWAKYYNGIDNDTRHPHLNFLTPFTAEQFNPPSPGSSPSAMALGTGSKTFTTAMTAIAAGDQLKVRMNSEPVSDQYMIGYVTAVANGSVTMEVDASGVFPVNSTSSFSSWEITNLTRTGMTFCNVTFATNGASQTLDTNTVPPLIRAAKGNFMLWAVAEGKQCRWSDVEGGGSNNNIASKSEIYANRNSPSRALHGLTIGVRDASSPTAGPGPDFKLRVQACASEALNGTERCKQYGNQWKPIGLLQLYGETDLIHFGLMTGSYTKNQSGGVLRKNIGTIADEIDSSTGVFRLQGSGDAGIINTMNRLRIYGYDFDSGRYVSGQDACGEPGVVNPPEGTCSSWGNPMSEIFSESLRYFAGKDANGNFTYTPSGSKDATLGLPLVAWADPISQAQYCAPLNILSFNSSVSTNDSDASSIADLLGSPSVQTYTNAIGVAENLAGNYMVGNAGSNPDYMCSPKAFGTLAEITGICPEAPMLGGSYMMAGAAHFAHTNRIRNTVKTIGINNTAAVTPLDVPDHDKTSLKVKTYGIALSTNTPKIKIKIPGSSPEKFITVMPAFRVMNGSTFVGTGTIVDFKVVRQAADGSSGKFFVTWDDSMQGFDYDLDVWGYISYRFRDPVSPEVGQQLEITTEIVYASQGYGSAFGFVVSGVNSAGNGVHFLTANRGNGDNVNVVWPPSCTGTECEVDARLRKVWGPVTKSFGFSSDRTSSTLEDPLWYASKWGGFNDLNGNKIADANEWDLEINNTGAEGQDKIPDSYFFVNDPRVLEKSLNQAFLSVLQNASSSSVAASSTKLNTNTHIFQASFNSVDWSGKLQAFALDANTGAINSNAAWNAGAVINGQDYNNDRHIFSYNPVGNGRGIQFRWDALSDAQKVALNRNPDSADAVDASGAARLNYLRGLGTNEGSGVDDFRVRSISKLGDIVNSSPVYVGPPNAGYAENNYAAFRTLWSRRTPIIYVGANDGMLHGFEAETSAAVSPIVSANGTNSPVVAGRSAATGGREALAYVPNQIFNHLHRLSSRSYNSIHRYLVDGTPAVDDAYFGDKWNTVLVSGLGAGGRGVFALDVTDPELFSESPDNAQKLVLWEFTNEDDADLGFTFSDVRIAKVCIEWTGRSCTRPQWVAVFGNGYNNTDTNSGARSATGNAALYILYLGKDRNTPWARGTNYFKITTTGSVGTPNGLASPALIDADGDGYIDFVYAGDLNGNMTRFNLTGNATDWNYATLFTARDRSTPAIASTPQPVTTRPEVGLHMTRRGFMVYFGTGRYLATGDNLATGQKTQTFYGIWDKTSKSGANWTLGGEVQGSRTEANFKLLQQKILLEVTDDGKGARITSDAADSQLDPNPYAINWVRNEGWYIDLYNTQGGNTNNWGEKQVTHSLLKDNQITFTTLIPNTSACSGGGSGWLMKLDPNDGSRINLGGFLDSDGKPYMATNLGGDGVQAHAAVSGEKIEGISSGVTVISTGDGKRFDYFHNGRDTDKADVNIGAKGSGRISWREIVY